MKIIDSIPFEIQYSDDHRTKNKRIWYDDDENSVNSLESYCFDNNTADTELMSIDSSAENAFSSKIDDEEDTFTVYKLHQDEIGFNYRGPKVLPINETPVVRQ